MRTQAQDDKQKQIDRIGEFILQNFFSILTLIALVASLWMKNNLNPVNNDNTVLNIRVDAIEKKQDTFVTRDEFNNTIKNITGNIGDVKKGVDTLIQMHLNTGIK